MYNLPTEGANLRFLIHEPEEMGLIHFISSFCFGNIPAPFTPGPSLPFSLTDKRAPCFFVTVSQVKCCIFFITHWTFAQLTYKKSQDEMEFDEEEEEKIQKEGGRENTYK